ncbi:MAG TPA: hypothetical protein VNG93_12940 [Candidatus Dormibacteraeota bacterium]|nr:hypothetical protein [Candidatus Dormibacteraeota bacterium]
MKPPRTAFLDYPLGNQVGPPGEPDLQRQILLDALSLFASVREPGMVVRLPYEWPDPGWRDEVRATYRTEAPLVHRQRLEGEYVDGVNVAASDCDEVCSLI